MILLTLACATNDLSGTWMFTRKLTPATGEECVIGDVSHNFTGASTPAPPEDTSTWTSDSTLEYSPEVFFGRLEVAGEGMVLILGTQSLPGAEKDGKWSFAWTNETSGYEEEAEESGYLYSHSYDNASTLQVSGSFNKDTFDGSHETETTATERWTESDSWSEEVAAVIGTTGQIPVSSTLVLVDGDGLESPISNDYQTFDCDDSDCTLSKVSSCLYHYELTGIRTEFSGEDARWVQGAGEAAGNG